MRRWKFCPHSIIVVCVAEANKDEGSITKNSLVAVRRSSFRVVCSLWFVFKDQKKTSTTTCRRISSVGLLWHFLRSSPLSSGCWAHAPLGIGTSSFLNENQSIFAGTQRRWHSKLRSIRLMVLVCGTVLAISAWMGTGLVSKESLMDLHWKFFLDTQIYQQSNSELLHQLALRLLLTQLRKWLLLVSLCRRNIERGLLRTWNRFSFSSQSCASSADETNSVPTSRQVYVRRKQIQKASEAARAMISFSKPVVVSMKLLRENQGGRMPTYRHRLRSRLFRILFFFRVRVRRRCHECRIQRGTTPAARCRKLFSFFL